MAALAGVGLARLSAIQTHLKTVTDKHNAKVDIVFSMRHIVRERALSTYAMYIMDDPFGREEELLRFTSLAAEFIKSSATWVWTMHKASACTSQSLSNLLSRTTQKKPAAEEKTFSLGLPAMTRPAG